ncbi:MAG: transcriptional regulator [Luteitalea sp.]|nr:transcriptional regulator [Luteitalea sp.]
MALTRAFKDTVQARLQHDAAFRRELLRESVECLVTGDLPTGKALLRDYINATVGFEALGGALRKSPKSLMRMLSPSGNPRARNLVDVLVYLQQAERLAFTVTARRRRAA